MLEILTSLTQGFNDIITSFGDMVKSITSTFGLIYSKSFEFLSHINPAISIILLIAFSVTVFYWFLRLLKSIIPFF